MSYTTVNGMRSERYPLAGCGCSANGIGEYVDQPLGDVPGGALGVVVGLGLTAALVTGLVIFSGMSSNPRSRRKSRT